MKQVIRWSVVHLLSLLPPFVLYYYAFEQDRLTLQFTALALLVLTQGILVTLLDKIINIEGRVFAIYPDAERFCSKHMGALMLVPLASLILISFLCIKQKSRSGKTPYFFRKPGLFAELSLGVFIFTVMTPILSLLYPNIRLEKLNFWISNPGAYTITQTVEKLREVGRKAQDPELLQVSDLSHHGRSSYYVSSLTFELVKKKLLHDLTKMRTRSLASENFERELGYVGNLCELMKWADNTKIMFGYFHKAYLLPVSGWDTSVAFLAEQYFLYSFKLEVHREVEHYFTELQKVPLSSSQQERLSKLQHEYRQLKAVRNLTRSRLAGIL